MTTSAVCVDYQHRDVSVPADVAAHVAQRHKEIEEHLPKLCDALAAPNLVYFRERTNSHIFYKLCILTGRLSRNYMVVIVRYSGSHGMVRTAYSTGRPATGDTLVYARR